MHPAPEITPEHVRLLYSSINSSQLPEDRWHAYSTEAIGCFVTKELGNASPATVVDVGCGNVCYFSNCDRLINIDLLPTPSSSGRFGLVANIVKLPLVSGIADVAICVGSVLNYVDALPSILELRRILKPGGTLIVEFETTSSLEFLMTRRFNSSIVPMVRRYKGYAHWLCLYSADYISDLLYSCGFSIVRSQRFHIVSALVYRLTRSLNLAGLLARRGDLALRGWGTTALSANIALSCICR